MALQRLTEHSHGECVRHYASPFDIPTFMVVCRDDGDVARRFANAMSPGVRRPREGDTFANVAGVVRDQRVGGTLDTTAPAAGGLGPTEISTSGYAWTRALEKVRGGQDNCDLYQPERVHVGDALGLICTGQHAGYVRVLQDGDVKIGDAVYFDDVNFFVLTKLEPLEPLEPR